MRPERKHEAEKIDDGQGRCDLLAEKLDSVQLFRAGRRACEQQVVIEGRHQESGRGQGQQGRAHAGRGAIELLLAVVKSAQQNRQP